MNHEPVYLLRRGRRVAKLIDAEDLAILIESAEDLEDLRAADAARAEMAETRRPVVGTLIHMPVLGKGPLPADVSGACDAVGSGLRGPMPAYNR